MLNKLYCFKFIKIVAVGFMTEIVLFFPSARLITIVFACVPQTLIHPLQIADKKQRQSQKLREVVFHQCEAYLNFIVHQLEASQLCPILSSIP